MQVRAVGRASSRAAPMRAPQRSHGPKVPSARRARAASASAARPRAERRTAEIVAALPDYRRSSVLSTLSVLARQGRIVRVGHGVYALPDAG